MAICLLATVALAGPASGARHHGHSDPRDAAGPLDLRRVDVAQSGRDVVLKVRTNGGFKLTRLNRRPELSNPNSRFLCLQIGRAGRRLGKRLCFGGHHGSTDGLGYAQVRSDGSVKSFDQIRARVKRANSRSVTARFRPSGAKLNPGHYRWRYLSQWSGSVCAAPPPPGSSPPPLFPPILKAGDESKTAASSCQDVAPDQRKAKFHLRRVQPVGCTHRGPSPVFNGSRHRKRIALTFDDGPSSYTSQVISILRHKHAEGTFFEIGEQVPADPADSRRVIKAGFELANHSLHHETDPGSASMAETNRRIKKATGFEPCLFRPPGGAYNSGVVSSARKLGMTTVIWDIDTRDWTTPGSGAIYSTAVHARSGSIVLMHDGGGNRSQTVAALPKIIRTLRQRGFKLVTVTRLLGNRLIWRPVG